jgi:hypothetical protein
MSIDDRLRAAFEETDETWDLRADQALRQVRRRHARGILLRYGATVAAVAAAVVAGVVLLGTDRPGGDTAPDPVEPPTTPARVDDPPAASSRTVLEGRWRTAPLDENDLRMALEESGNLQYADQVLPEMRPAPFRLVWLVTYQTAELRLVSGGQTVVIDKVTIAVDGDQVTVAPRFGEGATVHRFVVTGDELRLTFVSTTEGADNGVPGEVWQRLLYDTAGFVRS